ncbi:MAG: hypothetical protein JWN73_1669 [Betaproteobacteria bacterium]|nr:hypothetical protein [Betaproteobacteria bacterium]
MNVSELSETTAPAEQLLFVRLYDLVVGTPVNATTFEHDELYALKVIEHAMRSRNEELRNLAAHMQALRGADVEVITLQSPERLDRTWQMPVLSDSGRHTVHDGQPAASPAQSHELQAALARLSEAGVASLATLQRLYRAEFNRRLDLEQMVGNFVYGREVLGEALSCGTPELLAAVTRFLEELEGGPPGDMFTL